MEVDWNGYCICEGGGFLHMVNIFDYWVKEEWTDYWICEVKRVGIDTAYI